MWFLSRPRCWSLERGRTDSAAAVLQSPPARRALGVIARLLLRFAAACGALQVPAHAATLPPPPVSPAPVTNYEYDAKGNLTKVTKGKGVSGFGFTTSNAYDALDRVKTNTDARNGVTALGYDGLDQLKQVTDPRKLVTSYQRNGLGDLTQLSSPDTGTANSTFDPNGNLLTRTDSRGVLTTYVYDDLNRVTSAVYSKSGQSSVNYSWTYDQSGGDFGYGIGRLTTATGTAGNTKYGYDARGLVITVIQTVGTVVQTTRYGYNDAGRINRITYPSGRVVTIQYAHGLPTSMSVAKDASSTAQPLITDIQWEPFGGVRSWQIQTAAGPQPVERISDLYGRLVRYSLGSVVRDITYDAADRIVSYTHLDATTGQATAAASALNQSFGYDEVSRLTSIVTPSASWTIGYDANGNRTGVTLNGTARSYTTEATSNRLSSISNPTRSFSYDAAGNTLTDTGLGYTTTYRLDNRINSLTKAGVSWYYSYDAGGQRIRKNNGSQNTHFVYDQSGQLLGQYAGTAPSQEFVWLGDIPVAVLNGAAAEPEVLYVYSDHLNAPRVVVDKNSATRWRWISEPFGTTAPEEAPAGLTPVTLNLRFPGQYFDKESGLSYNYFRDYDGTSGRYVQSDPIGLAGGLNTYAYVDGSPLTGTDPQGLANSSMVRYIPLKHSDWIRPGPVKICHRPVNVSWIPSAVSGALPHHHWVKTPNAEAGMGGACPVPGQQCSDRPYSDTIVKNHTGESNQPGAQCEDVGDDIDVECVERLIRIGNPTGTWTATNQCMTFAYETIMQCRRKK